jgi:hypothetical protein
MDSSIKRWQLSKYLQKFEIKFSISILYTFLKLCLLGGSKITFPTLEAIQIRSQFLEKALVVLVWSSKSCHRIQKVKLFNFLLIKYFSLFIDKHIGLFHRAIAQSGSTGCPWALQKSVGEYTRIIAKDLNCPTSNSRELLDCMRKTEAEKIMESRKKLMIPIVCKNYILIQNIVGIEIFDYFKKFSNKRPWVCAPLHLGRASIPNESLRSFRTAWNHLCHVNSSIKCQPFSA